MDGAWAGWCARILRLLWLWASAGERCWCGHVNCLSGSRSRALRSGAMADLRLFLLAITAAGSWDSFNGIARVTNGREVLYKKEYGFLNVPYQDPMPSDAVFPIASNTKLYVALALYQLQEAGKVDLNRSVAEYLDASDFERFGMPGRTTYCPKVKGGKGECQVVRFVELLAMSSGIPNFGESQFLPYPGSIAGAVRFFLEKELLFVPGTEYNYSNSGFMFAAYFVEKLSNSSLREYLERHVFSVIGQKWTEYDPYDYKLGTAGPRKKRVSEYYQYRDPKSDEILATGACSSEFDVGSANGAGGVLSTAADQQLLYYSLFNFTAMGKPLLQDPRSLIDLVRPRTRMGVGHFYYAQGLLSRCTPGPGGCAPIPDMMVYEGGMMCVYTANIFDRRVSPPVMTSVYSSMVVFYAEADELAELQNSRSGDFFRATSGFAQPTSTMDRAWEVHGRYVNRSLVPGSG